MALVVTIAGIDRTSVTVQGSVYVEQRAADFISVCGVRLVDVGAVLPVAVEQAITLIDGGTIYFSGRVVDVRYTLFGECANRYIDIRCQDDNYKLLETIVTIVEDYPNGAGHAAILSDKQIITDLFNKYSAIVAGGNVATLDANLAISVGPCTLREALSQISTRTGGYFYVDFANQLHYDTAEGLGVGWSLSDTPGVPAGSVGYQIEGLDKQSLAMTRLDRVFVIGAGVTGWHPGAGAGRHGIARDNRITTAAGITERGTAILAKWGAIQDTYTVATIKAGLRAGMEVTFKCGVYGVNALLTVRKMIVKWDGCGIAYYTLTLGAPVNLALKHERNYADGLASVIPILPSLPTSSRGWSHNIVFSAPNNTQINWAGGGVITLADGSTYTIGAGNTGAMGAITYIYLDISIGSPPATLQITANAAVAVGTGKLLIAVAQNVADAAKLATFQVFGGAGQGVLVSQGHIAALSVTTNEIAANTILAGNIAAGTITANEIAANTITANEIAAATITATEIAANTITADKIEMGIGDGLFNLADGLLLLNPHCEISTTEWWSARKQEATLSGAFHREAGRWLGTRGLVIEEATTNLILNPSIEISTAGWSDDASTLSRDTTYWRFGVASMKVITDDVGAGEGFHEGVSAETAINTEYTFTVWMRGSGTVRMHFSDVGAGVQVGDVITLTNVWTRYQLTKTFGAGAARDIGITTNVQQAITWYCDGFQLEEQGYATSYADGTLGTGYAWTGVAHGSTSTRAATLANLDAHVGLISENATLSFRVVAQMPYAANATWANPDLNYFFDGRNIGDASKGIILAFNMAGDKFQVYIHGAWRILSTAQTFAAGDWMDLVLTVDFTADEYNLYVNGLLDGTDSTVLAPQTLTDWILGARFNEAAPWGGFNIAEFAVFDRVLAAIEIAGMYAMTRPMVDMGSLDKPGIYILDGRFRIASSTTGNRIDITADEIAGYSAAGVKQFYLSSADGVAYAGAGAVVLDATGLFTVGAGATGDTRRLRFLYDDAGTLRYMGSVFGDWGGGAASNTTWLQAWRVAGDPWPATKIILAAIDNVAGDDTRITIHSAAGLIEIGGTTLQVASGAIFNVGEIDLDTIIRSENEANLFRVDAGEDEVRLGDWDTNYSAFEVDGTLRMVGTATVFNDVYIPTTVGKLGGANTPTWEAFIDVTEEYTFAVGDLIHLPAVEIPHSYKEGSDIKIHCHIVTNGSDVGDADVRYEIVYTIGDMGETMGAAVGFASLDITIDGGTADRHHKYIFIGTIPGAGLKVGAALKMRFNRKVLIGAGDPPTDDPFVLMVGVHVEEDTIGSRTLLAK